MWCQKQLWPNESSEGVLLYLAPRSFKSCKFWGGSSMDQTCLSRTSHRFSISLRSGEFGGQEYTLNSLSCSSNNSWTSCEVVLLWHFSIIITMNFFRNYTHTHISQPWVLMTLSLVHHLFFLGPLFYSVLITAYQKHQTIIAIIILAFKIKVTQLFMFAYLSCFLHINFNNLTSWYISPLATCHHNS